MNHHKGASNSGAQRQAFVPGILPESRSRSPGLNERVRLAPDPSWYIGEIRERTARISVTRTIDVHAVLAREIKDLADEYLKALGRE